MGIYQYKNNKNYSIKQISLRIVQSFSFLLYRGNYSRHYLCRHDNLVEKALRSFPSI